MLKKLSRTAFEDGLIAAMALELDLQRAVFEEFAGAWRLRGSDFNRSWSANDARRR